MRSILITSFLITFTLAIYAQATKLYPVTNGKKYGLINRNRDTIVPIIYDDISVFRKGYAIVRSNNKFGMINSHGKEIIPPMYENLTNFQNGYTVAHLNDTCTLIDTLGNYFNNHWYFKIDTPLTDIIKVVNKIQFGAFKAVKRTIKHFHLEKEIGLDRDSVLVSDLLVGYISKNNQMFDNIWFSGGENFINGKAKVAISKHTYYLDVNGNISPRIPDDCDLSLMNIFLPDEFPEFPGGQAELQKFINKNFRYPENSTVMHHNAVVMVSIIIDKYGNVTSPKIIKSVDPEYDAEVYSLISKFEKWKPAKYDGIPVCYQLVFPIRFMVSDINR